VSRSLVVGNVKNAKSAGAGRRKSETSRLGEGFERTAYQALHTRFAERISVDGERWENIKSRSSAVERTSWAAGVDIVGTPELIGGQVPNGYGGNGPGGEFLF
jgi:hypothetical protein